MRNLAILATASVACCLTAYSSLVVEETAEGFAVRKDGNVMIERIRADFGMTGPVHTNRTFVVRPDGAKVWNLWSEERDGKFRLEIAQRADGAVEITLAGDVAPASRRRQRRLCLDVPASTLDGVAYQALKGNGRSWTPLSGKFGKSFQKAYVRWLVAGGVIWDANPLGAGDTCSEYGLNVAKGTWFVLRENGGYVFTSGRVSEDSCGGYVGTKIVLREGCMEDYGKYHLLKSHQWTSHLKATAVVFGAPRHGTAYADGNVVLAATNLFGWTDAAKPVAVGHPSGAYYAHAYGADRANYRFTGLADGFYLVTVQVGNWSGTENRFSLSVGDVSFGENIVVPKGKARTLLRAVHVTGGSLPVVFDGKWIVSAIAVQPLLGDGEDFSVRRGFWVADGFEPGSLYRNADYAKPAVFPLCDETIDMPPPGRECEGPFRAVQPEEMVLDRTSPANAWMNEMRMCKFLSNMSPLSEFDEPGSFAKYLDRQYAGKDYSVYMLSGMHSRHTYPAHLERGCRSIGNMAAELHRRGAKLLDHHDVTLLWNEDSGFRVMMERIGETCRSVKSNLPFPWFCFTNPELRRREYAYDRKLVQSGVDGFQLDEVGYMDKDACGCKSCRDAFHAETGWWLPLDETHPAFVGFPESKLAKRWIEWRTRQRTAWFNGLRRAVWDLNPSLCLSTYTVHWVYLASVPARRASGDAFEQASTFSVVGTEVLPRGVIEMSRALVPLRRMNNIFTLAYGVPAWGWYYNCDWQGNYFSWCLGNMCGQSSLLTDLGAAKLAGSPDYERWGSSSSNMKRTCATVATETALLFSKQSKDWNRDCPFETELFGTAQELEAAHYPYEFVCERLLTEKGLAKYRNLVLGSSNCLSDQQIAEILRFAERGGTVVLSERTGLYNEIGDIRSNWPFARVLGQAVLPKAAEASPNDETTFVERPHGAGRLVYFPKRYASRYYLLERTSGWKWQFNPNRPRELQFRQMLVDVLGPARALKDVRIPEKVYTSAWREADGTLALHFLNGTGANLKVGAVIPDRSPEPAFPPLAEDLVFEVRTKAKCRVVAGSPDFDGDRPLTTEMRDGWMRITLPKELMRAYTVVKVSPVKSDRAL